MVVTVKMKIMVLINGPVELLEDDSAADLPNFITTLMGCHRNLALVYIN